jgi:hypothetical protein
VSRKNRGSAAAAKGATRRAPQHRRDAGRHREPSPTIAGLVAVPASAGAKLATIGVIGTAAAIMVPAAASAGTVGGPGGSASVPVVNSANASPAVVSPIVGTSASAPNSSSQNPAVVAPAAASPLAAPSPPAMPSAAPVQLYNNLVPVTPTTLQAIQQYLSSTSGSVRVAGFTPVGVGGMVQIFTGPDGGAVAVGVGVGLPGASVKVAAGDQVPTQTSLGFQGTATFQTPTTYRDTVSVGTDTNLLNAAGLQDFGKTTLKGSYTFPGGLVSPQVGASAVIGPDTAGPGPNQVTGNTTVGGRVRVGSSELSGVFVVKIPMDEFNRAMAAMAAADGGPPMSTWYPDPTPQDRINEAFGQLAQTQGVQIGGVDGLPAQPPVPYLEIGAIQNPSGSIPGVAPGLPGEPINPVTGLPDSASGTQGPAFLPDQFMQPAQPTPAVNQFPATDALGNPTGYYGDPMIWIPSPDQPATGVPAPGGPAQPGGSAPAVPAPVPSTTGDGVTAPAVPAPAVPAPVPSTTGDGVSAPAVSAPAVPAPAVPAPAVPAPAVPAPAVPAPVPSTTGDASPAAAVPVYNPVIDTGMGTLGSTGLGMTTDPLSGISTGIGTSPVTGLATGLPTDMSIPSVAPVSNPVVSLGDSTFSTTDLGTSSDPLGGGSFTSGGFSGGATS